MNLDLPRLAESDVADLHVDSTCSGKVLIVKREQHAIACRMDVSFQVAIAEFHRMGECRHGVFRMNARASAMCKSNRAWNVEIGVHG